MMQKLIPNNLKLSLLIISLAFFGAFLHASLVSAQADIPNSTCQGANLQFVEGGPTGAECQFNDTKPEEKINNLIAQIINIFSVVVGVVAVIMIIIGGFRYITSGGDSGNVTSAKNTILYAIVGLIIVALAQFIVKFVLKQATSV